MTVEALAETIGTDVGEVRHWEDGRVRVPTKYLIALAAALKVSPMYFFHDAPISMPPVAGRIDVNRQCDDFTSAESIDSLSLLRFFLMIKDEVARQEVIKFAQALANNESGVLN